MEVPSSTVTPVTTTGGAAASARNQLTSNFDTFLVLLTAQLRHQDPLAPMDSNEFTQQLVQYSQVEQQINANTNLESLISLTQARNGIDSLAYLGKNVTTTDGSAALQNGEANWTYTLNGASARTTLTVTDANGKLVYVTQGQTTNGAHNFVWDGTDNAGATLPEGSYVLNVQALLENGTPIATKMRSQGLVTEVDLSGSEPVLMIGPMAVPISRAFLVSEI